jgi:glycosyltransferase involved in cell wall biosynthesis
LQKDQDLYLFTNKFPYTGGEPFLETEIHYLAAAYRNVLLITLEQGDKLCMKLPGNVNIFNFPFSAELSLKSTFFKFRKVFFQWYFKELIQSKFRFKYFSQFKWNLFRLAGLVDTAHRLNQTLPQSNSVYYSYWFNEWGSVLSILTAIRPNFRFITRVHLYDFEEEFNERGYIPFRTAEIEKPYRIFAISEYAKTYLNRNWPRVKNKTVLSRLGVRELALTEITENKQNLVIVTCSALSWYKRPLLLVSLIANLKSNITWHHFGDGNLKTEFLQAAEKLPQYITFNFHGHVPNTEVLEFYQKNEVHAVLNVSVFEGIPVALMEAISCGIPVIGCNVCGMPEIITKETGLLLEKEFNIENAAKSIEEFLKEKSINLNFRLGVQKYFKENYSESNNYLAFIEQLNLASV